MPPTKHTKRMVDPKTGERSDAADAISHNAYIKRQKVDPHTGEPSDAADAITLGTYYSRQKVDPHTGERSDAADAISYRTYSSRKKVDPHTGKRSDAADAITLGKYNSRKKVDRHTGEPSDAANAIALGTYNLRKKVDPQTGERSDAADAISYNAYIKRRKVDPQTGERSDAADAISYNAYERKRKKDKRDTAQISATTESSREIQIVMPISKDSTKIRRHKHVPEKPVTQIITTQPNTQDHIFTTTTHTSVGEVDFSESLAAFDMATSQVEGNVWDQIPAHDPNTHTLLAAQANLVSVTNRVVESATADTFDATTKSPEITTAKPYPSQFGLFAQTHSQLPNSIDHDLKEFIFDDPQFEDYLNNHFKSA